MRIIDVHASEARTGSAMTHNIKPLFIAGGFSTRKGTPKHLMPHSDGRPAYQHTLEHLMNALPLTDTFYISLRDEDQTLEMDLAGSHKISKHIEPIYDSTSVPLGPVAGLIAAHICAPSATWLIVGCDYPLLTAHTLQQLMREYVPPVTCFGNEQGLLEPLLAIWSPRALGRLAENVAAGKCGPSMTVEELDGKILTPHDENWIFGANTTEDWDAAMSIAKLGANPSA